MSVGGITRARELESRTPVGHHADTDKPVSDVLSSMDPLSGLPHSLRSDEHDADYGQDYPGPTYHCETRT
jgi:hypothetical protein